MTGCVYLEERISNHTIANILAHDPATDGPLFAFHATHSVHVPLEVVPDAFERFASLDFEPRRAEHAMVFNVDREIGRIIQALKEKDMYNDTLIIFTSDNGGMLDDKGTAGGNNFPLRGGKGSNWQGGIQVPAFISGGVVPEAMRGTSLGGLMTAWDWYATLVEGVAGLDPTDKQAAAAGLPPIDSVNQLDYLLGKTTTPPRQSYPIGAPADYKDLWNAHQGTVVHGVIAADTEQDGVWWKLMLGELPMDIWEGPEFPNATTFKQKAVQGVFGSCGFEPGCLFELSSDPSEYPNVAAEHPDIVARLRPLITAANATVFSPSRPMRNDLACHAAFTEYYDAERNAGFYGPFAHLAFAQA
jgi:arylsulfatase I/J